MEAIDFIVPDVRNAYSLNMKQFILNIPPKVLTGIIFALLVVVLLKVLSLSYDFDITAALSNAGR